MSTLKDLKEKQIALKEQLDNIRILGVANLADKGIEISEPITTYKIIKSIAEINSGGGSVGDDYFDDLQVLITRESPSFVIPAGITTIGAYAFNHYSTLADITIPNSVTSIVNSAFQYCTALENIIIPDSVTTLGSSMFLGCSKLTEITLGEGITSIYSLGASKLETLNYNCIECSNLTATPFSKTTLKTVNIGDKVRILPSNLFNGCTALTSIVIPDSVTSIGKSAFYGCSSLTDVSLGSGITSTGDNTFQSCTALTSIVIPDNVTIIGNYAFGSCTSLASVTIPNSVTSIGNSAFSNCTSLESIEIPDSVTSIGNYVFYQVTNLTDLIIGNGITDIYNLIEGYDSLKRISIGSNVNNIRAYSLSDHTNLETIEINPENATYYSIDNRIIDIENKTLVFSVNGVIPDDGSVTSIGDYAFRNRTGLTSITIPASIKDIGDDVFDGCWALTNIIVDENNTTYHSNEDGLLFYKTLTQEFLERYPIGKTQKEYIVPDYVTNISRGSFKDSVNLTSITLPQSIKQIDYNAFEGCENLTTINVPWSEGEVANAPWGATNATINYNYVAEE